MDHDPMNDTEIQRLAHAGNALRPDWPVASLRTWLESKHTTTAYRDAAVALAFIATDPATRTPKRMDETGPWWPALAHVEQGRPQPPRKDDLCDEHQRDRATCPASWHEETA